MIWIVISLVTGLGLLATWLGLRGRRVNDHPICRKCKFDLVGVYVPNNTTDGGTGVSPVKANEDSPRCPECGRDLSAKRAVRIGARRKRPFVLTTGALLLLIAIAIGGAWGWGRGSNFNWNTVKPVWLLQFEADGANVGVAEAALTELVARAANGDLSDRAFRSLAVRAMEVQSDHERAWRPLWGNIIEIAHRDAIISEEEFAQSLQRSAQLWVRTDPSSVPQDFSYVLDRSPDHPGRQSPMYAGEQQFLTVSLAFRGATWTDLFMRPVLEHVVVDGQEINAGISMHQHVGMVGSSGFNNVTVKLVEPLPAGVYEAETSWRLHVFKDHMAHRNTWASGTMAFDPNTGEALELPLPFRNRERSPVVEFPLTLSFQFTVEPQRESRAVHLVRDPELKALVEESIRIQFKEVRQEGEYIHFLLERSVQPLPVAIAFDVSIRDGDQEWPSAPLHVALDGELRMRSMRVLTNQEEFGVTSDRVDLILRPNPKSVELTVGFDAIWGDEVILRNVPVEWVNKTDSDVDGSSP